jgi:hypothetical protein
VVGQSDRRLDVVSAERWPRHRGDAAELRDLMARRRELGGDLELIEPRAA